MASLLTQKVTEYVKTEKLSDNDAWIFRDPHADPRLPMIMSAVLLDGDLYKELGEPDVIHIAVEWEGKTT